MARAFVGLGSNIDPERHIHDALRALRASGRLVGVSTIYRTPGLGSRPRPAFYNGVAALETALSPAALAHALKEIEQRLGRARSKDRFAPRTIDLDLLLHEGGAPAQPHPEIRERSFVAIPLAEVAPGLVLPDGTRITELAAAAPPWPMEPLCAYTELLREDLLHGHGTSAGAHP